MYKKIIEKSYKKVIFQFFKITLFMSLVEPAPLDCSYKNSILSSAAVAMNCEEH